MDNTRKYINLISQNIHNNEFLETYELEKSENGNYVLLNYNQKGTPNKVSTFCRGIVFDQRGNLKCLPFTRFFNLHESYADTIDWRYCQVFEKLDGSMISAWFDKETQEWNLSTRRMVGQLTVSKFCSGSGETIDLAEKFKEYFPSYEEKLDKGKYYVFEIVDPDNRIVTDYPEHKYGVYLLAVRNSKTLKELGVKKIVEIHRKINEPFVKLPEKYDLKDTESITKMFESQPFDFEGVVVIQNDKRIKLKHKSYLKLSKLIVNISNRKNVLEIILNGEESEVTSYFPESKEMFTEVKKRVNMLKEDIANTFGLYNHIFDQKEFALKVKDLPYAPFLFKLKKGVDLKYQFEQMDLKRLEKYIWREL